MKIFKTFLLFFLATFTMTAQDKKSFTLDDLMWGGHNYWNIQPRALYSAWWGDRLMKLGAEEVTALTDEKGRTSESVLFTSSDVAPLITDGTQGRGLNLYNARFPYADKPLALLRTSKSRFLYDWEAKRIVWTQSLEAGSANNEFCPASRSEAYTKDWNLFLRTADNKVHQISYDGSREIPYGTSVHRDEFGIHKGTFFSPSGKLLAFYRMDQSMVTDYPLVDIEHRVAEAAPEKYPMAGMTSHQVTVGIYNPETEEITWLQGGDPTDRYFTNISWAPDEKTIYMIELPRSQKKAELVAYDVVSGRRLGVLYTEEHPKYVHPMHGLTFLPWDSTKFIYQSERDGYNHLYLFDVNKGELCQLTKGDFVVLDILGFNEKTKSVIIQSTESSPIRNNYYSVNVESGKRTLLDNGVGVHKATLSAGGKFLCDRWSSPQTFREFTMRSVEKAQAKPVVLQADKDPWTEYAVPEISSGSLKAADGKTDLYYRMVKPVNFDPTKKYPAVVYVYGGPGLRNVEEAWNYWARPWEIYMAQKGYLLFVLDNRGSCDRGFEFESCTYKHLGVEEMKDQLVGVDYLKSLPYVDADRLGIHGWSFGGFMTTSLMCTYPDVFKVGVAGGPVIDWKYYEVMYGERYMSTPQENPEGYKETSLLNKARNLKGRLQIILGYNDPTCVPQHTLSFMRACIDADTQPDLFTYPNQGHNMDGHDMVHLHERITRYFEDYLK
ncbi:MAG: DPP IV N-terminal domain-containing protein [Alloprevotella sp.]|nr:DPP IV N-terminal domain-containing protein [Alloprevotella sp.]